MKTAVLFVLSLLVIPVFAQTPELISARTVKVNALAILGKGIAASPDDPLDFMIAKFGVGRVEYTSSGEVTTIGVLKLDEDRYRLKEVVVEEGKATGKIYTNSSEVGSFSLSSVMKGDTEVWAGTMELNEKTYNMYIIEGVRPIRASELKEKVVEYCNSSDDANCADRLGNYCENNPDDERCRALFRAYCMKDDNMEDTRCREAFRNWCEDNPTNKHCVPFALQRSKSYCEENSDSGLCRKIATNVANFCEANSDNEGCARVKEIVQAQPQLLKKATAIRARITNIKAVAASTAAVKSTDVMAATTGGG